MKTSIKLFGYTSVGSCSKVDIYIAFSCPICLFLQYPLTQCHARTAVSYGIRFAAPAAPCSPLSYPTCPQAQDPCPSCGLSASMCMAGLWSCRQLQMFNAGPKGTALGGGSHCHHTLGLCAFDGAIRNVMVSLLNASLCSLLESSLLCEFKDVFSVLTLPILITVYIVKRFKKQYLVFSGGLCASFPLLGSIYFVFENSALLCRPTN